MEENRQEDTDKSAFAKAEELLFPLAAAVIGIGYTIAILVNNPLDKVLASPHALALIAIFLSIAFFPVRSLVRRVMGGNDESGDGKN